jgi:hypothetical protein
MNKFALVQQNVVTAVYDKPEGYDKLFDQKNVLMIDVTDKAITPEKGWNYHPETGTFSPEADDQKWPSIRAKRDALLQDSDKYMLSDIYESLPNKLQAQWKVYRQRLRDIPVKFGPDDVIWPTPPSN